MNIAPTEHPDERFDSAIVEAARRFFADQPQGDAADALGLVDLIQQADSDQQRALFLAAVGMEAGAARYTGPVAEDCIAALCSIDFPGLSGQALRAVATPPSIPANRPERSGMLIIEQGATPTLSGDAGFIPLMGSAHNLLLLAHKDQEPVLVSVPSRDAPPELRLTLHPQLDGSDLGMAQFDRYPLKDNLILATGSRAQSIAERLSHFRWLTTAARLTGCAVRLITLTRDHLLLRQQFGRALAAFQALQHRLSSLYVEVEVTRALVGQVADSWADESARRASLLHALKARASELALDAAKTAVQLHGATGYCEESDAGLFLKHVMVLSARDGTAAEHRRAYLADPIPLS